MSHRTLNGYLLGKFQLFATTANRDAFADGAASDGNIGPDELWIPLNPTRVENLQQFVDYK